MNFSGSLRPSVQPARDWGQILGNGRFFRRTLGGLRYRLPIIFGVCEQCEEEIHPWRLAAIPWVARLLTANVKRCGEERARQNGPAEDWLLSVGRIENAANQRR